MLAGAGKVAPVAGLVIATIGAGWLQDCPFSVKSVGVGLLPTGFSVPLAPGVAVPLVARFAFHPASLTVTLLPDCDQVPPQPPPGGICWPLGNVNCSVQPLIAGPRFVMLTLTLKPWPQSLCTLHCTLQVGPAARAVVEPTPTMPPTNAKNAAARESALTRVNRASMWCPPPLRAPPPPPPPPRRKRSAAGGGPFPPAPPGGYWAAPPLGGPPPPPHAADSLLFR